MKYSSLAPVASRRHTVRFLLIVGAIALAGLLQLRKLGAAPPTTRLPLYLSIVFFQLLFVWFFDKGIRPQGHNLRTLIGKTWDSPFAGVVDFLLALAFVLLLRGITLFLRQTFSFSLARAAFLLPFGAFESVSWVVVSIIAGASEEIVYRGYLQRQFISLTGNVGMAIALQAVVFGLAHIYQGWRPALMTVP